MNTNITVYLKLFSGLPGELGLQNYNPSEGLRLQVKPATRLRKLLKGVGLRELSSNVYFISGERVSVWRKLNEGDIISCLKPSGGG